MSEHQVIVVGAGAAGIAAGKRLAAAGVDFAVVEARERIGGRAFTQTSGPLTLDLGCGWLHSASCNPWTRIARDLGFPVERSPAPWGRQSGNLGFSAEEQAAFGAAFARFEARIEQEAEQSPAASAGAFLDPGERWNPLLNAVFGYISGASLADIDARDYARYDDTGENWRVRQGYGALIAAYGADLPVALSTAVQEVDRAGKRIRLRTNKGELSAAAVILALPTAVLASDRLRLAPEAPALREAAGALPLGYAEKAFFLLSDPEAWPEDGHFFGRIDRAETGSYHLRSLGRPVIEAYFGGALAGSLAQEGAGAMEAFAMDELAGLVGSSVRKRAAFVASSSWRVDPYAEGSYSYARPGAAGMRAMLAAPVDDRLFVAGEACSIHRYSTAHGAYESGVEAAERALAAIAPP